MFRRRKAPRLHLDSIRFEFDWNRSFPLELPNMIPKSEGETFKLLITPSGFPLFFFFSQSDSPLSKLYPNGD
jgi:hypothetical protein